MYVERELTQWTDWRVSAIKERRAKLLEWAIDRWIVDLSELDEKEHEPMDTVELDEDTEIVFDADEDTED